MNKILVIILSLFLANSLIAQHGGVFGKVTDEKKQPLIGANVFIENTLLGTATDSKGNYRISNIPKGNYRISVSIIGYSKKTSKLISIKNLKEKVDFVLPQTSYQFDQLIITANKYEKDFREIAASSYVLDQQIFSQKNYKQIDDALRFIPSITMTADQISIRGSSGYSRGAGTRVLLTIDGIPVYSPDSGEIIWELLPISEISRIEIIKGSASSLYGSSAIGGVINIITKQISSNPLTYMKLQGGIYSKPSHKKWEWTKRTLSFNSQTISHSRTLGRLSLDLSLTRFEDYSYKRNDYQLRFAGFLKANYHFSKSTELKFFGTGYTRDKNTFNFWKNIETALSPPDDDLGQTTNSDRTILGMTLNHIVNNKLSISVIPSAYISYWKDDSQSNNRSDSKLFRSELRTNYNYSSYLKIISGLELQFNTVSSNIFGIRNSNGFGLYSQADYKPWNEINLSLGLRYDYNKVEQLEGTQSVSPKIGITYQVNAKTFLRGIISKGFRSPSLAEAFTSTTASGLSVKPNPNIKPETSYSMELGINHILSNFLSVDFSLFNNEYYDMIEPGFDLTDGVAYFDNVTRARIQGFDVSGTFSLMNNINLKFGYTYLWPRDINTGIILNYRPKHTFVSSISFDNSIYRFGFDFRYISRVESIDQEFVTLGIIPDGNNRVDIIVLDADAGINLFKYNIPGRFFLKVNNLLNYNYVELIGNISPIRNYSINMEIIF